jgi:HPt (histidine-containing phosphotransfer) domain-containing protein
MADHVVYVNLDEGKNRVMNNLKLYIKLLTKFKTGTTLDNFFAALDAGDYPKAQIEAHTIKGLAANLALSELFKQTLDVEAQVKAGSIEAAARENLKICFADTITEIDKVIAQHG